MKTRMSVGVAGVIYGCMVLATQADIVATGTAANKTKLVTLLNNCTGGATTSIGTGGKLQIGTGGNAYAGLLRDMINDGSSVTVDLVSNDPNVMVGRFEDAAGTFVRNDADASSKVSGGKQTIDLKDIEDIKNLTDPLHLPFTPTPWGGLIHEITEVFQSKKNSLNYKDAHNLAIDAENTSFFLEGTGTFRDQDFLSVPARAPVARPGGGWSIFMPTIQDTLGLGWWRYDWDVVGGTGAPTPFNWGYFGQYALPENELLFGGSDVELTFVDWTPIPEPTALTMVVLGGILIMKRRR